MDDVPAKQIAPSVPMNFNGEIYQNVGKYARGAVLFAFEAMGGPAKLKEWAEDNKDEFYTKLFPKIIARESEVTHHKTVDQLMDVIDGDYVIDGEFDEVESVDLPSTIQHSAPVMAPIAPNWNDSDHDLEAVLIDEDYGSDEQSAADLVEFEE